MKKTKDGIILRQRRCDFCHLSQRQCALMIEGFEESYICRECVGVCNEILADFDAKEAKNAAALPDPLDSTGSPT